MHTQYICAAFALLVVPCSSAGTDTTHCNAGSDGNCKAPVLANDQILLQGKALLHLSKFAGDAAKKHEFIDDTPENLRGSKNMEVRQLHLNKVLEQAADLARQGAGANTMASAGTEMESIDEKVLPGILADHEQASLLLELEWSALGLIDGHVEKEAKRIGDGSDKARKLGANYFECRAEEGKLLKAADECEKVLQSLDIKAHPPHGDHRIVGAHEAGQHQHGTSERQSYMVKEGECKRKGEALQMQRGQCETQQHALEKEWCLVQKFVDDAHGKLADSYAMALTSYEAAVSRIQTEEAARKTEFGMVEVIRCFKEHFLSSVEGSVADPTWIPQCNDAASESSGLDMSYEQPSVTAAAVSIAPEDTPCTAAFLHARNAALPSGVQAAPCMPCMASHRTPDVASAAGHMGLSESFWTGFHKGVQKATGKKQSDATHIEKFQKKFSEEGAESNFARFMSSFTQLLPGDWSKSTDMDLHHGFMNGLEAAFNSDSTHQTWSETEAASQESIDEHLDRAAEALNHAVEKVQAVAPSDGTVMASSGFHEVSESAKVMDADASEVPEVLPFGEI